MFTAIALLTLASIAYLTIRDWIHTPRLSSKTIQKNIKAASQHVMLGNWQEASELLPPILASGRGGKEALCLEIQVLRGTRRLREALEKAVEAARLYPEELLFRMEEGLTLLEMERPKEALEAFRVCAPIMRGEGDLLALAAALNRAGHPTQAFDLLEPWIGKTRNGELFALVGETFFERKRFHEAVRFYRQAIELGHKTHQVTTQLAHAYRRLGNLAESEKIFRTLLEKNPADLTATLGLGMCLQERGHFHKALLIYQSSGVWEQKDPGLLKEAGLCALRIKKYGYAEHYLCEVIQKREPEASLYAHYALALENQNKWQEAEQVYLQLIKLFPSYPHGFRALAWMFGVGISQTLSPEQGINFAHIALKLKNDLTSWEILSACEARVGHYERAYYIQMSLVKKDESREARIRRQQALRNLRKHHPLEGHHVTRSLVA
ncbi:MAG: tetratricopeptide repeat protein [Chlamydiales bacterium]|nr:tetratricopeptide repeat protein [Chlamydiales bacterium]